MIDYGTTYCDHGNPVGECEQCPNALMREVAQQRIRRDARRHLEAEERPPTRQPEIATLGEWLARPREPIQYRIDAWQPIGSRVILAAQYKAGKTTLTGNLTRSLVDGAAWLDRYRVEPIDGTLVILDFEMGAGQLIDWLGDQGIRNVDRVVPIPLRGNAAAFDILDRGRRAEWAAELRRLQCRYLIVDCLRPILDSLGLNEHTDAGQFLVPLDALLADAGVPEANLVHHMGHTGERSRGDSRIRDWPDVEWRLVRRDDTPSSERFVSAYGRDVEVTEARLRFEPIARHLVLVGGSRKDAARDSALGDTWEWVGEHPGSSGTAIEDGVMETTEHARQAVRGALKLLVARTWIHTKPGPKRATLHTQCKSSAPVRHSPPQSAADLVAQSCECASAP